MKVSYNWLKEYIGETIPSISALDNLLTFHAFEIDGTEVVGSDTVIDVKILPDRASDCLSHRGIAHEISALTGKSSVHDLLAEPVSLAPATDRIAVSIEDTKNCRRFTGALMTGVKVEESPEWLKSRLQALGQRSINNVVDATNYVMLGMGQPLHAYDADTFDKDGDVWRFGVRMARDGESVTTLTGETYELTSKVQLIVNGKTDMPVGVAGVKGGKSAEITHDTTTIILESANFDPQVTRVSAQSLKLQTDASKRFENGISPELVPYGLREVIRLITDIAGGVCEGFVDVYPTPLPNTPVTVGEGHIGALLGISIPKETIEDIFTRLGFEWKEVEGGWTVLAPFERTDILIPEDVIAEVGRVYGYAHIASVVPDTVPLQEYNAQFYYGEKIRDILVREGFSEVVTSSFRKKDIVSLKNALASDKGYLRSTLASNMQEVLDKNIGNADLLGIPYVQTFEIGTVFAKNAKGTDVIEHISLALGVRMKSAYTPKDDARLNEVVKMIEDEMGATLGGQTIQGVHECNLTEVVAQLPVPTTYDVFVSQSPVTFKPFSSYPYITRDIAFWTNAEVSTEELQILITQEVGELAVRVSLFDRFEKEGRVSYAFRLIFQSFEKTLTDEEVLPCMTNVEIALRNCGCEIR